MDFSDPSGALERYRQSLTSGRGAYDQAMASQMGALEQPVDRRGALMRMAQGFLSPTKTGAFAENVGMAVGNYADANDRAREQEMDRAMKLAQIQAARAKLQMEGAGQDFDLFSKGYEISERQRREGLLGSLYGGSAGSSLTDVAAGAQADAGFAMPALPGGGFSGAPIPDASGFGAPLVNAPVQRMSPRGRQMPGEESGEQRQLEEMQRLRSEEQYDLPTRRPTPPELLRPLPSRGSTAIDPNAMTDYSSGSAPLPPEHFSREMAIPPDQMQRFSSAPPQQSQPRQQRQQAAAPTGSDAVFASAERQRLHLEQLAQQNPAIRRLPEYQDEMKRVEAILLKSASGSGGKYGLTPVYFTDANGNQVLGQMSSDGGVKMIETPDGMSASPGVQRVDLGTSWGILNRDGEVVGTVPKDLAGVKRAEAVGSAEGESIANAPAAVVQADTMLATIDGVLNAPGREKATGKSRMFYSPFGFSPPGTETRDFDARLAQLQGQSFLQAFESLKGGGQITEVEGLKAENAIARLDAAQSDEAFVEALNELREVVIAGRDRAAALTQNGATPEPAAADGVRTTPGGIRYRIERP